MKNVKYIIIIVISIIIIIINIVTIVIININIKKWWNSKNSTYYKNNLENQICERKFQRWV